MSPPNILTENPNCTCKKILNFLNKESHSPLDTRRKTQSRASLVHRSLASMWNVDCIQVNTFNIFVMIATKKIIKMSFNVVSASKSINANINTKSSQLDKVWKRYIPTTKARFRREFRQKKNKFSTCINHGLSFKKLSTNSMKKSIKNSTMSSKIFIN